MRSQSLHLLLRCCNSFLIFVSQTGTIALQIFIYLLIMAIGNISQSGHEVIKIDSYLIPPILSFFFGNHCSLNVLQYRGPCAYISRSYDFVVLSLASDRLHNQKQKLRFTLRVHKKITRHTQCPSQNPFSYIVNIYSYQLTYT